MKQQIHPGLFAAVILGVVVVIGIIVYASNRDSGSQNVPKSLPTSMGLGAGSRGGASPDQQLQQNMQKAQQAQQSGGGGQ